VIVGTGDPFAGPGLPGPALLGGAASVPSLQRSAPAGPATTSGQGAARRTPGVIPSAPPGPLALARPHPAPSSAPTTQAPGAYASRITADTGTSPVVQASTASSGSNRSGAAGLPSFSATPVVQRVEGTAPETPDTPGHTETELDELAKALFGRIRTHLRTEVIQEREAKGLTFDAF
jgi:hypothetical protein